MPIPSIVRSSWGCRSVHEALAPNVSLDLNGFTIQGPITCTGAGSNWNCDEFSGGWGFLTVEDRAIVRNGRIVGFGQGGANVGDDAQVRDLVVHSNASVGVNAGAQAVLSRVTATTNDVGAQVFEHSVVEGGTFSSNARTGIFASQVASSAPSDAW